MMPDNFNRESRVPGDRLRVGNIAEGVVGLGLFAKVADEIARGASSEELLKWSGVFPSMPMKVVAWQSQWDGFWKAARARAQLGNDYEVLYARPTQRVVQIAALQGTIGTPGDTCGALTPPSRPALQQTRAVLQSMCGQDKRRLH